MASNAADARRDVRYEPDERPPLLVSCGLGLQYAMIAIPSIVLTPTILIQAADGSATYLTWVVCAALAISGITTAMQAVGIGRVGAGLRDAHGQQQAAAARSSPFACRRWNRADRDCWPR